MHITALEKNWRQTSVDKKISTWRKLNGNHMRVVKRSGCSKKERLAKKSFEALEGPEIVMARMSEIENKMLKASNRVHWGFCILTCWSVIFRKQWNWTKLLLRNDWNFIHQLTVLIIYQRCKPKTKSRWETIGECSITFQGLQDNFRECGHSELKN